MAAGAGTAVAAAAFSTSVCALPFDDGLACLEGEKDDEKARPGVSLSISVSELPCASFHEPVRVCKKRSVGASFIMSVTESVDDCRDDEPRGTGCTAASGGESIERLLRARLGALEARGISARGPRSSGSARRP